MSDLKLKPIILDQPGINEFYKVFGAGKETVVGGVQKFMPVDEIIARDVASKSSTQMPGIFTYENLKDGTAPLYDLLPLWKDMSIDQRISKLGTNDKIIQFLTRTSKGEKLEFGTMAEGAKRDAAPQAFSLTGLIAGAKVGTQIASKIPAVGLPGLAVKFGIPAVTSILGAFGGWKGGEFLTSQLFGDEKTILPGTRKAYAQGKTAVGALSWLPLPFLISKNVDFGAAKYLDNLAEMIKKGYVVNQPFSTFQSGVAKQLTTGKAPRTARIIAGIEKMLTASGQFAKKNPKATLAVESIVMGSQTTLAGESEQSFPGEPLPRIGMELTGSFVPGVLGTIVIDRFGTVLQALKNSYTKIKDTGFKEGLNILKQKQQRGGAEKIIKLLEEHGEIDPASAIDQTKFNALIKKLSEIEEFQTGTALTAGLKANSPVLMSIEAALAQTSRGLGKQQKSAISQQGTALRNMIAALIRTGDPVAIKEAMRLSQSIFETAIGTRLTNATQQLLESFSKVKGDDVETNAELGKNLFTMVVEQLSLSRKMERNLWNKVKTVEIEEFFSGGPKRKKLNEPNFIKVFRDEFKGDPEELIEYHGKTIGPLIKYVNRKAEELGLGPVVDPKLIDELAKIKAQDFTKVDNAIDKIIRFKGTKTTEGEILPNDKVFTAINKALQDNNIDPITMADLKDGTKFTKNQMDIIRNYFEVGSAEPKLYLQTGKGSGERNKDLRRMHSGSLSIYNQSKKYFEQIAKKVGVEPPPAATGAVDEVGTVTTNELVKMRSLALSIARGQSGPNGNKTAAGFATQFAKAILDDLNSVPEGANPNYDAARAFSAALNKVYTQTFAGDIVQKTNLGVYKNNPETLVKNLFSGGADATNLRVKQIFEIGNFAQKNNLEGAELLPNTISGTLNMVLRNAKAAAIDPDTGEFNQKALQRWMTENKDLLDSQAFQGLKSDLQNLDTAKTLLSDTFFKNKNLQKKLDDQLYFKNISGKNAIESPTYIAGMAIAGKNPTRDIRNLTRMAKASKNPEQALNGLYTSMLEYVMTKAGGTSQAFSARSMFDSLFSEMPTALKRTNLSDIMIQNGIATQKQMDNVKRFVTELVKYEAMEAAGKFGADDLIDNLNPVLGFYLKISGASIGQFVASKMPLPGSRGMGTGLIESQAGVEIMQRIFRNVPQSMKMDVMGELMQDPVRLAQMLKKVRTEQKAKTVSDSLSNWLLSSGFKPIKRVIPAIIREVDEEITGPEFLYDEQNSVQPNVTGSPTTQITARPDSGVNNRIAANVGSPPPAAPNVNQRAQFANLFPGDITSGLIKAQQPTQFMQDGGEVYDLREAPGVDDLRALTLEEYKKFTFQQLLNLKLEKDKELDKFNNPIKYLTQDFALGMNTPAAVAKLKQESFEKANQLEKQIQQYGMDREIAIQNYPQALAQGAPVSMRRKQDIESGNVQITGFPDYLVKPMQDGGAAYDMGLETDVPAQQSIMSGLGAGYSEDSEINVSNLPSSISYNPISKVKAGITAVSNPLVDKIMKGFKIGPFKVSPRGLGFTGMMRFADGGIVGLANGGRPGGMDLTPQDYQNYLESTDQFGPSSEFGTDVSEETRAADRYEDPDEAKGDMFSLSPELFRDLRGATETNPYPESTLSRLFGANTFQYANVLGGQEEVDRVNALRQAQALYPEDYTKKDFYAGQPTVRGEAVDVSSPALRVMKAALPYGLGSFLPGNYLPEEMAQEILNPTQQKRFDLNFSKLFDGTNLMNMFPFAKNFGAKTTTNQPTRSYEEEQLMPRPQINRGYGITELLNVSPNDQIRRNLPLYNSEYNTFDARNRLYSRLAPSEVNVNPFTYGGQQMFDLKNIRKGFGTNTKVVPDGKGGFIVQQLGI